MTKATPIYDGWLAFYVGPDKKWRLARDARGEAIICETEWLACSVAKHRRRRLKLWR